MRELEPYQFPAGLLHIPGPPKKLYLEGSLPPTDAICLCVVGARKYTEYGKKACEKLIAGLAGKNIAIISGLALGIDSIAHQAALNAGLFTLALPGSGLNRDVLYPRANLQLAEKILEAGGGWLSEYEPDLQAAPYCFPQRNRLMAGLSKAVLVIEAGIQSGTLITARLATEYNRDVLAVPGSIYSEHSKGPHMLIRAGAVPITCSDDLLEELGFERENENRLKAKSEKNAAAFGFDIARYHDCSPEEKNVLSILAARGMPISRDDLIQASALSASDLNILLSLLEIKGYVQERLGMLEIN